MILQNGDTVGIELEVIVPGQRSNLGDNVQRRVGNGLAARLSELGVPMYFAGYNHQTPLSWKIVTDASISAPLGHVGLEIVSPILTGETEGQIETVCTVLQGMGTRTNRSTGFHVHFSGRTLTLQQLKRLAWLYIENEPIIDGLLPPSRRGDSNTYCKSLRLNHNAAGLKNARDVYGIQMAINGGSRYSKLNFAAMSRHGTVEFRQHSGTVDPVKVTKWIMFCYSLINLAKKTADVEPALPALGAGARTPAQIQHDAIMQRINRAQQLRRIYELVARPEGATSVEVQVAINRSTPPALASDLQRMGAPFYRDGRRHGHAVYKIRIPAGESAPPEAPTLEKLMSDMGLSDDDQQYWRERVAIFVNPRPRALGAAAARRFEDEGA